MGLLNHTGRTIGFKTTFTKAYSQLMNLLILILFPGKYVPGGSCSSTPFSYHGLCHRWDAQLFVLLSSSLFQTLPHTPPLSYLPYLYLSLYVLCAAGIFTEPAYGGGRGAVRQQKKVGASSNFYFLSLPQVPGQNIEIMQH
jgi:hypothetical protein